MFPPFFSLKKLTLIPVTDILYLGDAVASNGVVKMTRLNIQAHVG